MERIFKNKYEDLINHAMEEKRGLNPESGYEIHHIIPKYIFKQKNLGIDNSEKNLVKLTIFEHIKAHQYWALYTEDPDACMAFVFLYGKYIKKEKSNKIAVSTTKNGFLCYKCQWGGGRQSFLILDAIYEEVSFCLQRKYEKYLALKSLRYAGKV